MNGGLMHTTKTSGFRPENRWELRNARRLVGRPRFEPGTG